MDYLEKAFISAVPAMFFGVLLGMALVKDSVTKDCEKIGAFTIDNDAYECKKKEQP